MDSRADRRGAESQLPRARLFSGAAQLDCVIGAPSPADTFAQHTCVNSFHDRSGTDLAAVRSRGRLGTYIPRLQEAHATIYHLILEAIGEAP